MAREWGTELDDFRRIGRSVESSRRLFEQREYRKQNETNMEELQKQIQLIEAPAIQARAALKVAIEALNAAKPGEEDARTEEVGEASAAATSAIITSLSAKQNLYTGLLGSPNPITAQQVKPMVQANGAQLQQISEYYQGEEQQEVEREQIAGQRYGVDVRATEAAGGRQLGYAELELERNKWNARSVQEKQKAVFENIAGIRAMKASGMSDDTIQSFGLLPAGQGVSDVLDHYKGWTKEQQERVRDIDAQVKREEARVEEGRGNPDRLARLKREQDKAQKIVDATFDAELEMRQSDEDLNLAERHARDFKSKLAAGGEAAKGIVGYPIAFMMGLFKESPSQATGAERVAQERVDY